MTPPAQASSTTGHAWLTALLRGGATYAVLCLASYIFAPSLFRAMVPTLKLEIETVCPAYEVYELIRLDRTDAEVRARNTDRNQPGFRVTVGYSYGFTYPILILSLLAGWQFPSLKRRLLALSVGAPLGIALMLIDLPAEVLLSLAEATQKQRIFLSFFFDNGGRPLLALIIFAVSIARPRRRQGVVIRGTRGERRRAEEPSPGQHHPRA
jgi:hypothetical protein